jgi:hypothetical protein
MDITRTSANLRARKWRRTCELEKSRIAKIRTRKIKENRGRESANATAQNLRSQKERECASAKTKKARAQLCVLHTLAREYYPAHHGQELHQHTQTRTLMQHPPARDCHQTHLAREIISNTLRPDNVFHHTKAGEYYPTQPGQKYDIKYCIPRPENVICITHFCYTVHIMCSDSCWIRINLLHCGVWNQHHHSF